MSQVTPMLRQYYDIKSQYPGCILFFRLGDFYEMFEDDAVEASKILGITLTSRDAGKERRIPMCGVPHHAAEGYIATLVSQGYKVALCEQVEDPKEAKGVVKREVVRVITPGTVVDEGLLSASENNFLAAVCFQRRPKPVVGLAYCDPSTGEFYCTQIEGDDAVDTLREELLRLRPAELLVDPAISETDTPEITNILSGDSIGAIEIGEPAMFQLSSARKRLLDHFQTESLEGFGCNDLPLAIRSAGAILAYLEQAHKTALTQISKLVTYSTDTHMLLDQATRRNLELLRTLRSAERRGSLLWLLDKTKTAMGGRLLRRWVVQPLLEPDAINQRLDAIDELVNKAELRFTLQETLEKVADIERLVGRVAYGSANARDLKALQISLMAIPTLKNEMTQVCQSDILSQLARSIDPCTDLANELARALVDDPPTAVNAGGIIRTGYSEDVDRLRTAGQKGKSWIAELEANERARTGIKSLKVGFNKVFGYYIEVTNPNLSLVPDDYERRQTLANAERFVTPALKEQEALILGAEEELIRLEYELFVALRSLVTQHTARLQALANDLAQIDVYVSLADVAVSNRFVRPMVDAGNVIEIIEGRHPIVEVITTEPFVPNDVRLDDDTQVILLTGPNMAGKSTYLRQIALIVLMAQIGSFVPAKKAHIGVVDRIFTRVGASDDLATGQSTFMVEMNEVANILNHATDKSLVILDEVGRGTSTFDGLSIAWAVTEHLHNSFGTGPKTLFATHYHELTDLEHSLGKLKNYSVAVHKRGSAIVFLRRIVPGGADQSYGIEVARLAGLPAEVIQRAEQILREIEAKASETVGMQSNHLIAAASESVPPVSRSGASILQIPLFDEPGFRPDPILDKLAQIDLDTMTPLAALNLLNEIQAELRQRRISDESTHPRARR